MDSSENEEDVSYIEQEATLKKLVKKDSYNSNNNSNEN
jgi:hypothetical protein